MVTRLLLPRLLVFVLCWLSSLPGIYATEDVANIPGYTGIFKGDLEEIRKRKVIRALVTHGQTDFFFHKGGTRGIQVDLLNEYAKFLNKNTRREEERVHITYIPVAFNELIPALLEGRGDIAADFLTITPQREKQVVFATGDGWKISELVVSHKTAGKLTAIEDLSGKPVYVLNGSSYIEHLTELNSRLQKIKLAPVTIVEADPNLMSEDILEMVNAGTLPITVIDDYIARAWARILPDIRVHEDLVISAENSVGWAVRKQNQELHKNLNMFAQKVKKGTLHGNMIVKRYYSDAGTIKNPTSDAELNKLGKVIALFEKYGKQYGFDAWALMAQAYQESGLDNSRKSPTGAVGIMQILPSTAKDKHVNIGNVKQLENNIHAATKYLAFLRDRYFSDPAITPDNQLAFTWAAYNAGPAKVRKMREQAGKLGLDPDIWFGNVELAASKLVGRETVRYVAHVYKYYVAYKLASESAGKRSRAIESM